jgi:hypothetical protein
MNRLGRRLCVLLLLATGCLGARTDLWEPPDGPQPDALPRDDGRRDDGTTADADADARDTIDTYEIPDVRDTIDTYEIPDARDTLDTDLCAGSCDDGIACTADSCDPATGCRHEPIDAWCDDGVECTLDRCDPTAGCLSASDPAACDDGLDCTADDCDWATGLCVHLRNDAACDDRAACTTDRCEPVVGCAYHPDDWLCPAYEYCDVTCHGCAIRASAPDRFLAFTEDALYRVDPGLPAADRTRAMGLNILGLAVLPDGRLWGSTDDELFAIEPCNLHGTARFRFTHPVAGPMAAGVDGLLYKIGTTDVWRVDPATLVESRVGPWDDRYPRVRALAPGPDGRLYAAARTAAADEDVLFVIDPVAGTTNVVGSLGVLDLAALASAGGALYALSASGALYLVDPTLALPLPAGTVDGGGFPFVGAANAP